MQAAIVALSELESTTLDEQTLDAIDQAEDAVERGGIYSWEDTKKRMNERLAAKRAAL